MRICDRLSPRACCAFFLSCFSVWCPAAAQVLPRHPRGAKLKSLPPLSRLPPCLCLLGRSWRGKRKVDFLVSAETRLGRGLAYRADAGRRVQSFAKGIEQRFSPRDKTVQTFVLPLQTILYRWWVVISRVFFPGWSIHIITIKQIFSFRSKRQRNFSCCFF